MVKVKLSKKGYVALPATMLTLHQWGAGTEFVVWDTGRAIVMQPITLFAPTQLEPPTTPSVYAGKPLSLEEMEQAIDAEAGCHK